ncbi:interleukin-12 subunit beta [Trachinotus anak]|uniref:interleukin-12 subunit beta n=1 Tax=Trachinotus anak TaxID=443729 RepID=UPI0039F217C7
MTMVSMMYAVCKDIKMKLSGLSEHTVIRTSTIELLLLIFFIASLQCHFIQMKTLSLWIFGLLLISPTGTHGLNHFPESFVVAKKDDPEPVTLTCRTNINGPVNWTLNDDDDLDDIIQQDGKNLKVSDVDAPVLGNYSCWREEELLSSTYLLLEAEEEDELDSLIRCWAKSYNCTFSCNWYKTKYTAVRLGLGSDCRAGGKSCHWVSSTHQLLNGELHFELSHSLSPFAEETTMLELTVEAIAHRSILRRTKKFFLRDIIQPDSPQIVKCQEVGQKLNVTVEPPSSWSSPHSFFSLQHEVEYELKDNGKVEHSVSTLIPKKINKLRVRSRDALVLSNWSQWTPWKNVISGKKKLCRCRNTAKYCCPELPSGSLDNCKKRRKKKRNKDAKRSRSS